MLLLSMPGVVMMMAAVIDVGTSANYRSSEAALYAADSGLQQSIADFLNDVSWAPSFVDATRNPPQPVTTFPDAAPALAAPFDHSVRAY